LNLISQEGSASLLVKRLAFCLDDRMKIWLSFPAILCLISSPLAAQEYDIQFQRPSKVGDRHVARVKLSVNDDQQFTVNGDPLPTNKKESLEIDLTAQFEELAVDKDGRPTEQKLTIRSCQCTKDGESTPLFKAGDEIKTKEGRPKQFFVNGEAAKGLAAKALTELFPPIDPDSETDDRLFGPGHKVKMGESWPINAELVLANLSKKMGVAISKDALTGSVKLESANAKNGVPCLQLAGNIHINATGLPLPGAPPEVKAKKMEAEFLLGGDFPEDHSLQKMGESMELHFQAAGGGTMEKGTTKTEISFRLQKTQKLSTETLPSP
jgi:hypothetical protein